MKWTSLLFVFVLLSVAVDRIKTIETKDDGSGDGSYETDVAAEKDNEGESDEEDFEHSGDGHVRHPSISVGQHQPSSAVDSEEDEEDDLDTGGNNGGAGFVFKDDTEEETDKMTDESVPVQKNNLMTHPAILTAVIVGGVLVLVCLIVFFILIICCVRKKDEGSYDLDKAMKEKLKYITYTKADSSEKEFFA